MSKLIRKASVSYFSNLQVILACFEAEILQKKCVLKLKRKPFFFSAVVVGSYCAIYTASGGHCALFFPPFFFFIVFFCSLSILSLPLIF